MEFKVRSKSSQIITRVNQLAMLRLRSLTKFNGVLQNIRPTKTSSKSTKVTYNRSSNIQNQNTNQKQAKNCKHKLPPVRKMLKLDNLSKVKAIAPVEGYRQFQIQEKTSHPYLHSTVSKNGVILTQNNILEYFNLEQLQKRCKNIQKLKKIQTIKYLPILKPFLKWKIYSKIKRFKALQQSLKSYLNVNILIQQSSIYQSLSTYFQTHKIEYIQQILRQFQIINKQQQTKLDLFKIYIQSLVKSYQNMSAQHNYKNILNIQTDFKILLKLTNYQYRKICEQYSLKLAQIIHQQLVKQFYNNRYRQQECKEFLAGNKTKSMSNLSTKLVLQIGGKNEIVGKIKHQSLFNPYLNSSRCSKLVNKNIFQILRCNDSIITQISKVIQKNVKFILENFKFNWEIQSKQLSTKMKEVSQCLNTIVIQNIEDYKKFITFLKAQMQSILKIDMKASNKIVEVKNKLAQIEAFPQQINFGMLSIQIKSLKVYLNKKIGSYWSRSCEKLPKDIQIFLSECEKQALQMENKISASVWAVKDIVKAYQQNLKFSTWKESNNNKMVDIQKMLEVINKVNPRISQNYSVRFIKFKLRMKAIATKSKTFQRSLPQRIKLVANQKKTMIQQLQSNIRQFNKKIAEFRKTQSHPKLIQNLKIYLTQIENKINDNLISVTTFMKIQKNYNQCSKQIEQIAKITNSFNSYQKQILFYVKQLQQQNNILTQVHQYINKQGNNKIINIVKPNQIVQKMKQKIINIKKNVQQINIQNNILISSIICNYNEEIEFFKSVQVLHQSCNLHNQFSRNSNRTIKQIYSSKIHINMKDEIQKIAQKLKIIQNYVILEKQMNLKFQQHRIFPQYEISINFIGTTNREEQFISVNQAIDILRDAVDIQDSKINNILACFDEEWKNFLREDYTKTIQSLKNNEKAIQLLARMCQIRSMYHKNKQITFCKGTATEQKIKDKWILLFNHFQDCSLNEFIKKQKSFEKILKQIQQIQLETQQKIEQMLNKSCNAFPLLYLFDKNIIFKSILDPMNFIKHFFNSFNIEKSKQNNQIKIKSNINEKLTLQIKQNEYNLKNVFLNIQKQIKNKMNLFYNDIILEKCYNPYIYFKQKYENAPLQILSFIDKLKLNQQQLYSTKQKLSLQIKQISNYMTNIYKNNKIDCHEPHYTMKGSSFLIVNRIQMRDLISLSNLSAFSFSYEFNEDDANFYINVCNFKSQVCYNLISSQFHTPITSMNELYFISNIHQSLNNPECTLLLPQNSLLQAYSFMAMRYLINFPLFSNKFHNAIFASLKTKVILNFQHSQKLESNMLQNVHFQLFKYYYHKLEKIQKSQFIQQSVMQWPIFVTLPFLNSIQFRQIKPQLRSFFRKLKPIQPNLNSITQICVRNEINSLFVTTFMKYATYSDQFIKCNQYTDFKKNLLRFIEIYNNRQLKNGKLQLSGKLLSKIITKIIKNIQLFVTNTKISYSKFKSFIKINLISLLTKISFYDDQKQISKQILSIFQIKNVHFLQGEQIINSYSSKKVEYELEEKQLQKFQNIQTLNYYLLKAQQLKQILKQNKMIAILGKPVCGKTFFIQKCLQNGNLDSQKILKIHQTALGEKIWNEQNSFLKSKKLMANKNCIIIDGPLSMQNCFYLQKMLQTKQLYYSSSQKVVLPQSIKIIFEVQNSDKIDPYVLVELHWLYLKSQELKWKDVLTEKIKTLKNKIINFLRDANNLSQARQIFINQIFLQLQTQCQTYFYQIISVQNKKIFNEYLSWNTIICHTSNLFNSMIEIFLKFTQNPSPSIQLIKKSTKAFLQLIIYSFHMVLNFSNFKESQRILQKIRNIRANLNFTSQKLQQCIPKVLFNDEKYSLKFEHISDIQNYQYYSLLPSLNLVPNYKYITIAHLIKVLLLNQNNVLIIGKQCSGKSAFIKNINKNKTYETIRFRLPCSYETLIFKLKYKRSIQESYNYQKQSKYKNITFYIEDCALDLPENHSIPSNLKYLWQTKQFIDQNLLKKQNNLNFIIQWSEHHTLPSPFIHLNQFYLQEQKNHQTIYNYTIQNFKQIYHTQNIDPYQHTQLCTILLTLQNFKRVFQTTKMQNWKHKYSCWNIEKALDIYFKNKNHNSFYQFGTDNQQQQIKKEYWNWKIINAITLKLISLSLTKQEQSIFQKLTYKPNNNQNKQSIQKNSFTFDCIVKQIPHTINNDTKQNIQRILQSAQMQNILLIQHKPYNNQMSLGIYALKINANYRIIEIIKNLHNYQDFVGLFKQKYKSISSQTNQKNKKIVFYFSSDTLQTYNYDIINYIQEFIQQFDSSEENISKLENLLIVIEYNSKNTTFINKIQKCKKLLRKSLIVSLEQQQKQLVQANLIKKYEEKFKNLPNGKDLLSKILKIYNKIHKKCNPKNNITFNNHKNNSKNKQTQEDKHPYLFKVVCKIDIDQIIQLVFKIYQEQIFNQEQKQNVLKNTIEECEKIIKSFQQKNRRESQLQLKILLAEKELRALQLFCNKLAQEQQILFKNISNENYKTQDPQTKIEISLTKNHTKRKKDLKRLFKHAVASMSRTEVSELKFIFINNKQLYSGLFQCISLTLTGESDPNNLSKILLDVNLTNKIRQFKFNQRSTECLKLILIKIKDWIAKTYENHILKNIIQWIYYGANLQIHLRNEMEYHKKSIQMRKSKQLQGIAAINDIIKCKEQQIHKQQIQNTQQEQNSKRQIKLQEITKQLNENNEKITYLTHQHAYFEKQKLFLKNIIGNIQNFQVYNEIKNLCELQLQKKIIQKRQVASKLIQSIFLFKMLPQLSSIELMQMKQIIIQSVKNSFQQSQFYSDQIDATHWQVLYLASLSQQQIILKKSRSQSRKQFSSASSILYQEKLKYKFDQSFKPTSHQLLKLYNFLLNIKQNNQQIIINRQQIFKNLVINLNGSIKIRSQKKHQYLNQILCYAIQIQQDQWTSFKKQSKNKNEKFKKAINSDKFQFFMTNSLGQIDNRLNQDKYNVLSKQYKIIDFGVDKEDIKQIINQKLLQLIYQGVISTHSLKSKQLIERQYQFYQILNQLNNELPHLSLNQQKQINKLNKKIKQWLQQNGKQNQQNTEMLLSNQEHNIKIFLQQFVEIYTIYQHSLRLNNKINRDKQFKLVNLPQKFIKMFLHIFKQVSNSKSINQSITKIQLIKNSLILSLFQSQASQLFKINYFLKVYTKKISEPFESKHITNFLFELPLQIKLKKLLNHRGIDPQINYIEQMPYRNVLLETQTKNIIKTLQKPQQYLKQKNNQKITQQNICQAILKIKQLNYIEKLTLIKILTPATLSKILYEQIQKMIAKYKHLSSQYIQIQQANTNTNSLIVCQCDINLWRIYLPAQIAETKIGSSWRIMQMDKSVKFFCYSSLNKLPQTALYSRNSRIILVHCKSQYDILAQDLNNRKIHFDFLPLQKVLQIFWAQLVTNTDKYQLYSNISQQFPQNSSYTQRYIAYIKYKQRIQTLIKCNKKIQNIIDGTYMSSALLQIEQDKMKVQNKQIVMAAKKIYTDMCKVQIQMFNLEQCKDSKKYAYIAQFMKMLQKSTNNIQQINIKLIIDQLRLKLLQTLSQNKNSYFKSREILKQKIVTIYEKVKQNYQIIKQQKLQFKQYQIFKGQTVQLISNLYNLLYLFCRIKACPTIECIYSKQIQDQNQRFQKNQIRQTFNL